MGHFADYAWQALRVRLPEDYVGFMETYGKRLSEDPLHKESWIGGLGSPDFVMGTTLAFRSTIPAFRPESKAKSSPSTASRSRVQGVLRTRTSTPPAFRDGNLKLVSWCLQNGASRCLICSLRGGGSAAWLMKETR